MYDVKPNLLIGFHGCDESVAHSLLTNPLDVKISKNPYDWLGNGFYVWENNLERAKIWAEDKLKRGAIKNPAIIGIVYTLGNCCDLADSKYISSLNNYYHSMKNDFVKLGRTLPVNKDYKTDAHKDLLYRALDCSVIEYMHYQMKQKDSVKDFDTEGGQAFPGSGINSKNHIQVCIRNLDCVKGFFKPRV